MAGFKRKDRRYITAAILRPDRLDPSGNVPVPDEDSVAEAKKWVDDNQK